MAPSRIIENIAPVIRVSTPVIKNIPPKNSASAIGICNSAGNPLLTSHSCQLGLNFLIL